MPCDDFERDAFRVVGLAGSRGAVENDLPLALQHLNNVPGNALQGRQFGATTVKVRWDHDKSVRRLFLLVHCFGETGPGTDAVDQKRGLDVGHGPVGGLNPYQAARHFDGADVSKLRW